MIIKNNLNFDEMLNKRSGFVMRDAEKWLYKTVIEEALKRCFYNQTKTSEILGITRNTLASRIHQYDIQMPLHNITDKQRMILDIEKLDKGEFIKIGKFIVNYNGKYYYTECGKTSSSVRIIVDYINA